MYKFWVTYPCRIWLKTVFSPDWCQRASKLESISMSWHHHVVELCQHIHPKFQIHQPYYAQSLYLVLFCAKHVHNLVVYFSNWISFGGIWYHGWRSTCHLYGGPVLGSLSLIIIGVLVWYSENEFSTKFLHLFMFQCVTRVLLNIFVLK